jgi:type IV pilus biogenesis protein CpaD/CtpE
MVVLEKEVKNLKLTLLAATALLLGACASKPPEQIAKVVPPPTDMTLEELNVAIDNGVKLQNEKGEDMVCRKEAKTGSRLARETICMTRAEWLAVSDESQRNTQKNMRLGKVPHGT